MEGETGGQTDETQMEASVFIALSQKGLTHHL